MNGMPNVMIEYILYLDGEQQEYMLERHQSPYQQAQPVMQTIESVHAISLGFHLNQKGILFSPFKFDMTTKVY